MQQRKARITPWAVFEAHPLFLRTGIAAIEKDIEGILESRPMLPWRCKAGAKETENCGREDIS